jgi:hypothetical protein
MRAGEMKPTQAKIDNSVRYMRRFLASEDGQKFRKLAPSAQLLYIIGLFVCDDVGHMSMDALKMAEQDPEINFAAAVVAGRVGLLKSPFGLDRYA